MALGHARGFVNVRVRGWLERPGRLGTQGVHVGLGSLHDELRRSTYASVPPKLS